MSLMDWVKVPKPDRACGGCEGTMGTHKDESCPVYQELNTHYVFREACHVNYDMSCTKEVPCYRARCTECAEIWMETNDLDNGWLRWGKTREYEFECHLAETERTKTEPRYPETFGHEGEQ